MHKLRANGQASTFSHRNLIVLLRQVMKRFSLKLLPGASSAKAVQKDEAHPDQSKTILDNAITVLQHLTDTSQKTLAGERYRDINTRLAKDLNGFKRWVHCLG